MKYFLLCCIFILNVQICKSQLAVDLESGAAFFGYCDVRIPGNSGTRFSLTDNLSSNSPIPFFRARLNYDLGKRHTVSALYAPLSFKSKGSIGEDISFQNTNFEANDPIAATWKFNSYRISYQYKVILRERFLLALGLTGKVRDAKINLSNSMVAAEKSNLGVVPLIRFYMDWNVAGKFNLILDGDALASPQGRAEDVFAGVNYPLAKNLKVKAGYRILEGGVYNDEVYNFSAVHYAVLGLTYKFW